jgi:hypothetical protein
LQVNWMWGMRGKRKNKNNTQVWDLNNRMNVITCQNLDTRSWNRFPWRKQDFVFMWPHNAKTILSGTANWEWQILGNRIWNYYFFETKNDQILELS